VGGPLELRNTEHFFLDLSKMEPEVQEFLKTRQSYWRDTVIGESLRKIQSEGLKARPITRDLDWGIPVPVDGWDHKRLYVWFEAVIGYLSAAIEWARINGQPEAWKDWWTAPAARTCYFIGKDNIFFHAAMWPAELMGAGEQFLQIFSEETGQALNLPYDVPANQFMNLEGQKISGSRNWAVWGRDFLTRYDPDPLRYYLTVNMPETRDTDWDWNEFYHRNNDELVATWGNLANRVLSFAFRNWDGRVPEPGELRPADQVLLATVEGGFQSVGEQLDAVHLRAALGEAMRLATEVNKYLNVHAPWFEIKADRSEAAKSVFTALKAIDSLKVLLAPFLPFTSEKLHTFLGYDAPLFGEQSTETIKDELGEHLVLSYLPGAASGRWEPSYLRGGELLQPPQPLYKKLDAKIVEEERARLGK
jgi:methionyl-tRNA synthetase